METSVYAGSYAGMILTVLAPLRDGRHDIMRQKETRPKPRLMVITDLSQLTSNASIARGWARNSTAQS